MKPPQCLPYNVAKSSSKLNQEKWPESLSLRLISLLENTDWSRGWPWVSILWATSMSCGCARGPHRGHARCALAAGRSQDHRAIKRIVRPMLGIQGLRLRAQAHQRHQDDAHAQEEGATRLSRWHLQALAHAAPVAGATAVGHAVESGCDNVLRAFPPSAARWHADDDVIATQAQAPRSRSYRCVSAGAAP